MSKSEKHLKWLDVCDFIASKFSTCSRKQYAAVILSPAGRVVGIGYNGSPPDQPHCSDGHCPRAFSRVAPGSPYDAGEGRCIAVHAEANALLYSDMSQRANGTLYVNGPPCPDCAKLIGCSGISAVVFRMNPEYPSNNLSSFGIRAIGF